MKTNNAIWVYDIETLINCLVVCFINVDSKQEEYFVLSEIYRDSEELQAFLENEVTGLIGFNNLGFDSPVLFNFLKNCTQDKMSDKEAAMNLYLLAQSIIAGEAPTSPNLSDNNELKHIHERDLYLIHHFNNEAKRTSLKWIECHLGMSNISEMPFPHDHIVTSEEEIKKIVEYCLNDCHATLNLWNHERTCQLNDIRRWAYEATTNPAVFNMSNASIGEAVFKHMLQQQSLFSDPIRPTEIYVNRILFPYIHFKTEKFQKIKEWFESLVIPIHEGAKGIKIEKSIVYDGMKYQFGLGGLHAARENSLFENVYSVDVQSYYPNLAIQNRLHPRHLDQKIFIDTYSQIFEKRKDTVKGTGQNLGLKELLNCVFGKSNSIYSFFYDPYFTFAITINGQLLLAKLCEDLTEAGVAKVIMANTDGIELQISDTKAATRIAATRIIRNWEAMTGLKMETNHYKKIMIRDVNNYIALTQGLQIKAKGAYEINKEFHKDPSGLIIPILLSEWFQDIVPESGIASRMRSSYRVENFYMYARAKTGDFYARHTNGDEFPLQKTVRYLIGKTGYLFVRRNKKRADKIHKDAFIILRQNEDEIDMNEKDLKKMIDYNWYAKEVSKLIVARPLSELTLF